MDSATITSNVVDGAIVNGGEQVVSITSNVTQGATVSASVATGGVGPAGPQGAQGVQGPAGNDATVPDATALVKGKVQLAGDLGGTAGSPTVKRTVTKTVAPTGTLADYNTDGIADDVEINAALAAVAALGGGEVRILFHAYIFSSQIIHPSNVALICEPGTTLTQANGSNIALTLYSAQSATNIRIENLTLDGNKTNNTSSGRGITLADTTFSKINNVTINNTQDHAINIRGASYYNLVEDCNGNNINGAGLVISNGATYNKVVRQDTKTATNSGVYFTGANYNQAIDCYSEATYYGFDIFDSIGCSMSSCEAINPTYDQFHIEDSQNVTFDNCIGSGGGRDGLGVYSSILSAKLATNITINGGHFLKAAHYGVSLNGTSSLNIKTVVLNNVEATGSVAYGIYSTYVNGLTVNSGILDTNGASTYDGIRIDVGTINVKIGGGIQIINNGGYAIRLNDNTVTNVEIGSTHFRGNGTDDILIGTTGTVSALNAKQDILFNGLHDRQVATSRSLTGTGSILTLQSGFGASNMLNQNGGDLIVSSGGSTGSARSAIRLEVPTSGSTGVSDNAPAWQGAFFQASANGPILSLRGANTTTGLPLASNVFVLKGDVQGGLVAYRNITGNTAGQNLTIQAGGATSQATNKNGGNGIISAGISTGSGTSQLQFKTAPATSGTLGTLSSVSVNAEGSGYTANDVLSITGGGGSSGTATVNTVAVAGQLATVAISAAGTGYTAGDALTISGGTGGTATVGVVNASGAVLTISLTAGGSGYSGVSGATTAGGTGTGATLNTTIHNTGGVLTISVAAAGTGYALTTGAATTGGTGTGATLNLVPFDNTDNAATTKVTILGNGNVGIGTITPASPLDVAGTINATTYTGAWGGSAIPITNGGTGQTTASAAFNALSPNTTLGDITYGSGTNTSARLVGSTSATKQFLTQTGNGSVSAAPAWGTIAAGDVPTLNQNTTGTAAGLSATLTVGSGGTGQTSYTDGQLLIGNTSTGGLTRTTLTGTSNQITVTNGSGSITLSTPQDIATASSPTFGGLTLNGNVSLIATAAWSATQGRATSGNGNTLTIQSGGGQSGANNANGGDLILASGIATGSARSSIEFWVPTAGSSGTADNATAWAATIFQASANGPVISTAATATTTGLPVSSNAFALKGTVAGGLTMYRHTTSNTAGNNLSIISGGATSAATDKAAGDLVLKTGLSTGIGGANVRVQTMTRATSTGTADNTATDRIIAQSPKSVTNNSATTLSSMTLANGSVVAGRLSYTVEVTDGTDFQYETGVISYGVTNKAGAIANNVVTKFGNQQAATTGTLVVTFTITAANPALIQVNANSSLTPSTGYPRVTFVQENLSQQAVAIS